MDKDLLTQYYTKEVLQAIKECKDYEDMRAIAMGMLHKIPKPIAQVCGPISTGGKGSIQANIAALEYAMAKLINQGINIFDQAPFEEPMQRIKAESGKSVRESNQELLDKFYLLLFQSGLITTFYFLPGWESSFGASWERRQAKELGIEIIDLPEDF